MYIDLYKDRMQPAELFGKRVLYSDQFIAREEVPEGWHCYDLCGTDRKPDQPLKLKDSAVVYRIGTVLSPQPLKKATTLERKVKDLYVAYDKPVTLAEFCQEHGLPLPQDPRKFTLRPASPEEAGLFYALPPERDEELGAIGHVRMDFGRGGKEFYHSWWPRGPKELNSPEFKAELQEVVDELRKNVLKSLGSMNHYCWGHNGEISGGSCCQNYGYVVETERYLYRLRCNPTEGDYQAYLSCFDKQAQQMGLTEKGCQLSDAADPAGPHNYEWYVMEAYNTPEEEYIHDLSLEEAIQQYVTSENPSKRLGVIKDDVDAVDLIVLHDGREWLSQDRLKSDNFKNDPAVADAVEKLQRMLDEHPAVGRVTFASGERWSFTDPQKYLQTVREELPYQATTGFRCETLTDDPEVRKAVDDMVCDLYGEENPRLLADYGSGGMMMGGMGS